MSYAKTSNVKLLSHRRRGGPTGHAKKSQSSPDILVEETVIDTKEESDLTETLVDQTDSVDSIYHASVILDNNTEARQTPLRKCQGRKSNNDQIKNKTIRFLSYKKFLEKCLCDKLTPNCIKVSLESITGNENVEFVNQ